MTGQRLKFEVPKNIELKKLNQFWTRPLSPSSNNLKTALLWMQFHFWVTSQRLKFEVPKKYFWKTWTKITSQNSKYEKLLISVKKIFPKENIKFSSRRFFPFPETAHDAQGSSLQRRWCFALVFCIIHVSVVTAVGKPEMAGSIPPVGHNVYKFSDTREHILIF